MRRVEEPGEHQGAPARWWWWLASSPRRWLRFGLVRRWRRRWWWVASPSSVQEETPEASGDTAAASPHNDVLAAALLNGSSPAHLPALEANLAASHLDASLVAVESSASTTSQLLLQEGVAEASEHGASASPHSDVLVAAVVNASPPCHLQEGPEASGHGVAASQHTAPTSPSPPDRCDGTIVSLEEEEEVAVVVEQFVISLSGHGVAASQHTALISPSPPDSCDGMIISLEEEEVKEEEEEEVEKEEEEEEEVVVEQEEELEEDDDDLDKKTYAIYLSHVAETPKNSIVCLMCFLEDGKPTPILKSQVEKHCNNRHNTLGIKCGQKAGCMVRARFKGDIGRHYKYCHDLKAGWWKKPPRPDRA